MTDIVDTTDPIVVTRVIFRVYLKTKYWPGGDVIAILLDCAANPGRVVCYHHLGQHGEGEYFSIVSTTRPATRDEYAPLLKELIAIGYAPIIRTRRGTQYARVVDNPAHPANGNATSQSLTAGVVYDIAYRCTTPGPDIEEGTVRGYWTGEIDTWGKHTVIPVDGSAPRYLFRREFVDVRRCGVEGNR